MSTFSVHFSIGRDQTPVKNKIRFRIYLPQKRLFLFMSTLHLTGLTKVHVLSALPRAKSYGKILAIYQKHSYSRDWL